MNQGIKESTPGVMPLHLEFGTAWCAAGFSKSRSEDQALRRIRHPWLWSKPFWGPILVGIGEFATRFGLPILVLGLGPVHWGCDLEFGPWPLFESLAQSSGKWSTQNHVKN